MRIKFYILPILGIIFTVLGIISWMQVVNKFIAGVFWGISMIIWMEYTSKLAYAAREKNRYTGIMPSVFNFIILAAFFYMLYLMLMSQDFIADAKILALMALMTIIMDVLKIPFYWQEVKDMFKS